MNILRALGQLHARPQRKEREKEMIQEFWSSGTIFLSFSHLSFLSHLFDAATVASFYLSDHAAWVAGIQRERRHLCRTKDQQGEHGVRIHAHMLAVSKSVKVLPFFPFCCFFFLFSPQCLAATQCCLQSCSSLSRCNACPAAKKRKGS